MMAAGTLRMTGYSGRALRTKRGTERRAGRILVIDDEPRIGEAIALVLDEHVVVSVTRAEDALDRLALGEGYDVILCDIRMPGVSGIDFYDRLVAIDAERAACVAFITSDVRRPEVKAFLDRVPNGLVEKPFDPDTLRAFVDRMMTVDRQGAPRRVNREGALRDCS
jgi:CheY-like chemotaxis protein